MKHTKAGAESNFDFRSESLGVEKRVYFCMISWNVFIVKDSAEYKCETAICKQTQCIRLHNTKDSRCK